MLKIQTGPKCYKRMDVIITNLKDVFLKLEIVGVEINATFLREGNEKFNIIKIRLSRAEEKNTGMRDILKIFF